MERCSPLALALYTKFHILMWKCEEKGVLSTAGKAWSDNEVARATIGDSAEFPTLLRELLAADLLLRDTRGALYLPRMVHDGQVLRAQAEAGRAGGRPPDKPPKGTGNPRGGPSISISLSGTGLNPGKKNGDSPPSLNPRVTPPSVDDVITYGRRIQLPEAECRKFLDHHEAREWVSKGTKLKNWQRCMSTWASNWRAGTFAPINGNARANGQTPQKIENASAAVDKRAAERRAEEENLRANADETAISDVGQLFRQARARHALAPAASRNGSSPPRG